MNNTFFSRIELLFWNFAIQALSRFRMTRSFSAGSIPSLNNPGTTMLAILMGVAGVAGLVSGYLFYFLAASLR